jgi:hypothetical protein
LLLQSNAFTTTWIAGNVSLAQNATGIDGTTSAWTLTDSSAAAPGFLRQSVTLTAATHTVSWFIKKTVGAQSTYPVIAAIDTGTNIALATIDTSNGIATVWTAYTAYTIVTSSVVCVSFNANYWKVSLTFLASAVAWLPTIYPSGSLTANQSTGVLDSTSLGSCVATCAQLEAGAFATSYIPTVASAVTRAADVLTYPSAGNISGTVGTCYAEVTSNVPSGATAVFAGFAAGGGIPLYVTVNQLYIYDVTTTKPTAVLVTPISTVSKVSNSWYGVVSNGAAKGVLGTPQVFDGDLNTTANLEIGSNQSGANQANGTIRNVRIWPTAITAAQQVAITTP